MPLNIIRADITTLKVDAIVSPTDIFLSGSGSIDKILADKGNKIVNEKLDVSEAIIKKAINLPCEYIIYTVGPRWLKCNKEEKQLLKNTYNNCLSLVKQHNIKSVAFPLISTGTFSIPKEIGLDIATKAFTSFLLKEDVDIYLVVYDKTSFAISQKVFSYITEYIDDNYVDEYKERRYFQTQELKLHINTEDVDSLFNENDFYTEDTFVIHLFKLIDKKGLKDPEVYKKANIDRKLFSKIRSDDNYNPSKKTAIALSLALNLNYKETQDLLARAGYTLSKSNKFDLVIEACIKKRIFNVFEINNILYSLDLPLIN